LSFSPPRQVYLDKCYEGLLSVPQDSADGIANELLSAGLIVGEDLVAMAANNLDKLIASPPPNKHLTFRISAGIAQQETPDEKALLG
jgi:serine/threonine-protein kinase OSR1/STK39